MLIEEDERMAMARTAFLALLLALGVASGAEAQTANPLIIAADMVRGPGGSGPGCVLIDGTFEPPAK
jgi:hypothetical protein